MEINYKTKKLEKTVINLIAMKKYYGIRAKRINQMISDFKAASSLEEIRYIPSANCHELHGNMQGFLAVDISRNHRIIFKPANNPLPLKKDKGLDWALVTKLTIFEIGKDYHLKKKL